MVKNKTVKEKQIRKQINEVFFDAKGINTLFISSLEKKFREEVLNKIIEVYLNWNIKINTSKLNKWLELFWKNSENNKYNSSLKQSLKPRHAIY